MTCLSCRKPTTSAPIFIFCCGHGGHRACIRALFYDAQFNCPVCRRPITAAAVWQFGLTYAVIDDNETTSMAAMEATHTQPDLDSRTNINWTLERVPMSGHRTDLAAEILIVDSHVCETRSYLPKRKPVDVRSCFCF